jgi:hypothetical protein
MMLPAMTNPSAEKAAARKQSSEYALYKPNARGTGGVVRFELNRERGAVFVDGANQSGEKQFDWAGKITMKWGLPDLGAALAVLERRMPQAKLFHQTEKANSAFELTAQDGTDRAPYFIQMSRQAAATKQVQKVSIPVSHAEAAVLETALKTAVARLLGW